MLKKIMKVFNSCDKCYAVNQKIAEIFYEYGAKTMPLVQQNATDMLPVKSFEDAALLVNKKLNIPLPSENVEVFLFVGRINAIKNIFFIIDSLEILSKTYKNFRMVFVGEGQDFEKLKEKIKESNIESNVILTGKIEDRELLTALYARAKLFLFPSLYDANSLVQIEAASQKTPVVFLKDAATASTVADNVNGFLSDNSPEKYAEKILSIINDEDLYNKVSEGAFRDLYVTWEQNVISVLEYYNAAIKEKRENK